MSIGFAEPDGQMYSYAVAAADGYTASPAFGSVTLNGANRTITVMFIPPAYAVTFTEGGLPPGTNWSVTLGGATNSNNTTTVDFEEPNGTYTYLVGAVPGWVTADYAGSITVRGGAIATVDWLRFTYMATFAEDGLPPATEWWVNVTSGGSTNSVGSTLSFYEPNGTYFYSAATLDKTYSSPGGSFTVDGRNVSGPAVFSHVTYAVTVAESGLPSETGWWLNVTRGPSIFSPTDSLSFEEPNGTYTFSGSATNSNYSSLGGTLAVNGAAVSKTLTFALTGFTVTFTESGLPAGTGWAVTFHGTKESGTENLQFVAVRNGTYAFTIGPVGGYTANRTSGMVTVRGGPVSEPVTFGAITVPPSNSTRPATLLGLPTMEGYGLLGGALIAILVVTMVVLLMRRRGGKTSPEPAKPGRGKSPQCAVVYGLLPPPRSRRCRTPTKIGFSRLCRG